MIFFPSSRVLVLTTMDLKPEFQDATMSSISRSTCFNIDIRYMYNAELSLFLHDGEMKVIKCRDCDYTGGVFARQGYWRPPMDAFHKPDPGFQLKVARWQLLKCLKDRLVTKQKENSKSGNSRFYRIDAPL